MTRPVILLSAFACDPQTGSEPYVGWHWAGMLAEEFEVHVLTRRYSKHLIDRAPDIGVTFHYLDLGGACKHDHYWRFIKPYYLLWQVAELFVVARLHIRYKFSILHHVTYNNVDAPGWLWAVPGTRFIWGPVGGGQTPPEALKAVFGKFWWKERLRAWAKRLARFNPAVRLAARRADLVFFANKETYARLEGLTRRCQFLLETGIDPPPLPAPRPPAQNLTLLWVGHVVLRKALGLALDAFSRAREKCANVELRLQVIGDGPNLAEARRQAGDLDPAADVSYLGWVSHSDISARMAAADALLFTSVQDTSGNVVLEAMAHGLPIIGLRHQGVAEMVKAGGGVLVDVRSYAETVEALADAIVALANDPALRANLGGLAREEVLRRHSWTSKRPVALAAYREVLDMDGQSAERNLFSAS